MTARLIALLTAVCAVLGGLYYVRHINAERVALRAQYEQAQARVAAQQAESAAVRQQQERNDAATIQLQQREQDLARIRDGLGADLARSPRQSATRAAREPAIPRVAGRVPDSAAGAGVRPATTSTAAADRSGDADSERFNSTVDRLARHADEASGAADTAAAQRNAIARLWQEHRNADQARRAAVVNAP